MSEKECIHHRDRKKRSSQQCLAGLVAFVIFIIIILFVILIIWAVLQPKKPRFVLQDATVYAFNVTSPYTLTSSFQLTITARNRNSRIGIYYDHLHVHALYRSQQITYFTEIPPTYQGHKDFNTWSPFVYGTMVPVAPYNSVLLNQDQANGAISLMVKLNGRVRWKVGTFISGHYHLHVNCPAYIPFGSQRSESSSSVVVGNGVKYQLSQRCSVSV